MKIKIKLFSVDDESFQISNEHDSVSWARRREKKFEIYAKTFPRI